MSLTAMASFLTCLAGTLRLLVQRASWKRSSSKKYTELGHYRCIYERQLCGTIKVALLGREP